MNEKETAAEFVREFRALQTAVNAYVALVKAAGAPEPKSYVSLMKNSEGVVDLAKLPAVLKTMREDIEGATEAQRAVLAKAAQAPVAPAKPAVDPAEAEAIAEIAKATAALTKRAADAPNLITEAIAKAAKPVEVPTPAEKAKAKADFSAPVDEDERDEDEDADPDDGPAPRSATDDEGDEDDDD